MVTLLAEPTGFWRVSLGSCYIWPENDFIIRQTYQLAIRNIITLQMFITGCNRQICTDHGYPWTKTLSWTSYIFPRCGHTLSSISVRSDHGYSKDERSKYPDAKHGLKINLLIQQSTEGLALFSQGKFPNQPAPSGSQRHILSFRTLLACLEPFRCAEEPARPLLGWGDMRRSLKKSHGESESDAANGSLNG